ncbi:2-aminoglycoside phosphotransferase [Bacillus coahuilensis m2-6]|uniref:2-aminoglycoside phosphotransferase n=2 Tax=Bacillus coahuilensis TaxID=408580 RepID=A0A147KC45_9BACI|nr:GNAT family N-acetyltransferase [Bacillus coahuilensis]KUP09091.1 2-aminoglycoside phosphotransferase [Bacillus coahuilensis p1.1.43]KUP09859.1 2-aminoglycoside phosphotransferase [Bacillus coahuilensis m2-6]
MKENDHLVIRDLEINDTAHLVKWLSDPRVLEYYEGRDNPFDKEKVKEAFYGPRGDEVRCIIEYDGKAIGYVQYYPIEEEEREKYGYPVEIVYGMDQFIGEVEYWNKGIGTSVVSKVVKYLLDVMGAEKVVMDPQVRNERALRCYEKCGFKKVKLLPRIEWHEGVYEDCWLIEASKNESVEV